MNKVINKMNKEALSYHTKISYLKSTIRILGYITIPFNIPIGVSILVASEILGYIEEFNE